MMEVNSKKVWICLVKGSNGNYIGYFASVVEPINTHVKNFVACPEHRYTGGLDAEDA